MDCVCPNCGKKMSSDELVFDFTEFIREELGAMLKEEQSDAVDGWKTCFNELKNKSPFLEREIDLWNLEKAVVEHQNKDEKYVNYKLPYYQIKAEIEKLMEMEHRVQIQVKEAFKNWLDENRENIMEKTYVLSLKKTGDGDIHMNKVFKKENGCEEIATERLCPFCRRKVSFWAGRYREFCLTVLGGPRISKSTTLTACAAAFIGSRGRIRWEGTDEDKGYVEFEEEYLRLYNNGKRVKATSILEDKIPRVSFKVTVDGKNMCLTFIDLPGEYNNEKGISKEVYGKYEDFYDNIDFVWYCTDAGEVQQLVGKAENENAIASLGYEEDKGVIATSKLQANMIDFASSFRRTDKKVKVPVAYILGKSDTSVISDADKREFELYSEKDEMNDDEVLDLIKFHSLARKVEAYFEKHNPGIINTFRDNFEDRCYIATSAYGYDPKHASENERLKMRPYHCKLPFFWMLAMINGMNIKFEIEKNTFLGRTSEEVVGKMGDFDESVQKKLMHNLCMRGPYMV